MSKAVLIHVSKSLRDKLKIEKEKTKVPMMFILEKALDFYLENKDNKKEVKKV